MKYFNVAVLASCFITLTGQSSAQNSADVMAKVAEIEGFLELLNHENPLVRQAAIEEGIGSKDRIMRESSIKAGFASTDEQVRKAALIAVLESKPALLIEAKEETIASKSEQEAYSEINNQYFVIRSEFFNPSSFSVHVDDKPRGSAHRVIGHYTCKILADEAICVNARNRRELVVRPGPNGAFVGHFDREGTRIQFILRNF